MDTKTLCLGVLSMGDATGYEIWKQFEEGPFSHFFDAGFGSIYPALNRLLEDGLVTCTTETQQSRPTKKVYSLTEAGLARLTDALHEEPARDKVRSDSLAIMFFGHMVASAQRAHVLDDYIAHFRKALEQLECREVAAMPFGRQFAHGFGLAIYRAALDYLETHKDEFLAGDEPADAPRAVEGSTP